MHANVFDNLKSLFDKSSCASAKAHELIFERNKGNHKLLAATMYLNKAVALMSAAKAIYICNLDALYTYDIESIFHKFDTFESEFMKNLSEDHSHQWTDIEFNSFNESYQSFLRKL
jgi:hypothetical protein